MNKIKIVLLSAVLAIMLCACGEAEETSYLQENRTQNALILGEYYVIPALNEFAAHPEIVGVDYNELTYNELSVFAENSYGFSGDGYVIATAIDGFERGMAEAGEIVTIDYANATTVLDGNEIIIDVPVVCENRNADIEMIFSNDLLNPTLLSAAFNTRYTMGEKMSKAGLNTVIGMGTVFIMLILISYIIGLLGPVTKAVEKLAAKVKAFFAGIFKKKKDKTEEGIDKAVEQIVKNETAESTDAELVAVIAAAVAAYEGTTDTSGFVVRSIRKIKRL